MFSSSNLQSHIRHKKLLTIAINVTNTPFYREATEVYLTQIKEYQIWRDRDCVALIDKNTRKVIVFGFVKPQPELVTEPKNITSQNIWKYIRRYHDLLWLASSQIEIDRAWQLFRPLDPQIQQLYQTQKTQKHLSNIVTKTQKLLTRFKQTA